MMTKFQNGYKYKKVFYAPFASQQKSNLKKSKQNKKFTKQLDPQLAELEENALSDFDDDEMKKYRIGG